MAFVFPTNEHDIKTEILASNFVGDDESGASTLIVILSTSNIGGIEIQNIKNR